MIPSPAAILRLRRIWTGSIQRRLTLGITLLIAVVMGLLVLDVVLRQRDFLWKRQEERGMALAQSLAVSSASWVLASDVEGLREVVGSLAAYPDLSYAMVLTRDGKVLGHTDARLVGLYARDTTSDSLRALAPVPRILIRTETLQDVAVPIQAGKAHVGWVRVGLSNRQHRQNLALIARNGLLLALAAIALGALFALLVSRGLTRGLARLVALTHQVGSEDKPDLAGLQREDELGVLANAFDGMTTQLDQALRQLREQQRYLQDLLTHLPVAVVVLKPDATLAYLNPAARDLLKHGAQTFAEGARLDLGDLDFQSVVTEKQPLRGRVLALRASPGAPPRWAYVSAFPEFDEAGDIRQVIVSLMDITDRERAEEDLRRSADEIADLYNHAPCGYHSLGPDGTFLRINDTELAWLGFRRDELVGRKRFQELCTPEGLETFERTFPVFKVRGWVKDLEFQLIRKDGTYLQVLLSATALKDSGGNYIMSRTTLYDITDRLRAEAALNASRSSLAEAQRIAHLGNWALDLTSNELSWSEEIYRIFEVGPDSFGATYEAFLAMVHPEDRQLVQEAYSAHLENRVPYDIVHRILPPSGHLKYVNEKCETVYSPEGKPLRSIGTVHDITERMRMEQERRRLELEFERTQKLESLGTLAGGIAHDINNILSAILGLASTYKVHPPPESPLAGALGTIETAGLRGRDLVRRLLDFSRKRLEAPQILDLNHLVREQVELLRHTTLQKAEWILELQEPCNPVKGDPSSICTAIINLCVNALDAMTRGGSISLRTLNRTDGALVLEVEDTGSGMPPEVLAKAMEPFFTTKPAGKGTGLGLSIVYSTMKAHGGGMEIHSRPGEGTCVRLQFPAAPAAAAGEAEQPEAQAGPQSSLRILLVDDDELILLSVSPMLQLLGHTVDTASSGPEALSAIGQGLDPDLVILDQNMPGMSGTETLLRMLATRPRQAVLMASGAGEPEALDLPPHARLAFIPKPFTFKELQAAIGRTE